jgi:Zn-finger protein
MSTILSEKKIRKNFSQNNLNIKKQALLGSNSAIEANFESQCTEISLKSNIFLEAKCNNRSTSIDLSKCVANFNGKLVYTINGAYEKTCNKCAIKETKIANKSSSYNLECSCPELKSRQLISQINLKDILYVKSGSLLCDEVIKMTTPAAIINPSIIDTNCDKVTLVSNNRFTATCTNANSGNSANRVAVDFSLDNCITNQNGQLLAQENGSYSRSCRNCKIEQRNKIYFLVCNCADITNAFKPVESALNKFITFSGNSVRCLSSEEDNKPINIKPASNTAVDIPAKPVEKLSLNNKLSPADNFMILCKNLKIENVSSLIAFCGDKHIEYVLNLDSCLTNIDGAIKIAKDGGYGRTCRNCAVKFDHDKKYVLECTCQRADWKIWIFSNISLRERIVYNESKNALECLTNIVLPEDNNCS